MQCEVGAPGHPPEASHVLPIGQDEHAAKQVEQIDVGQHHGKLDGLPIGLVLALWHRPKVCATNNLSERHMHNNNNSTTACAGHNNSMSCSMHMLYMLHVHVHVVHVSTRGAAHTIPDPFDGRTGEQVGFDGGKLYALLVGSTRVLPAATEAHAGEHGSISQSACVWVCMVSVGWGRCGRTG
jgi:hypothetical protein